MPSDRETLEVDVLFVGAGPAGLAGALHLAGLAKARSIAGREAPQVAVIEKAAEVGHHLLSGAILDPVALRELVPDFLARECPVEAEVGDDAFYILGPRRAFSLPAVPAALRNGGHYVVSICRLARWLAQRVEEAGVNVFTGFPGSSLLFEGERVAGVRTGDRGVDRRGGRKGNFEAGVDLRAKVTVLCEGARGSLTKQLVARAGLDRERAPQIYATAVKEVWKVPAGRFAAGRVFHTLGHPLDSRTFGGGFAYGMRDDHVALGLVVGCDVEDPATEPHRLLQEWKRHPLIAGILEGGELAAYGAKAIAEGGWYARPRPWTDGCLIAGDAGGYLNSQRLKGIHLAMKTGMLAAETAYEALAGGDASGRVLAGYERAIAESWVRADLWPARNFRQAYDGGLWKGLLHTACQMATGGRGLIDPFPTRAGHERMRKRTDGACAKPASAVSYDGRLTFDKRTDLFHSGTQHEEDQPCHLVVADTEVCRTRCREEYGNPCERFCPANVYEMVEDRERGGVRLQINAANCVHCKTCDIMDPYQIITWVTPEGGGGPRYTLM